MQINFHFLKRMQSIKQKLEVAFGLCVRHLKKSIWRHNSSGDRLIETKFGTLTQNHMPMNTQTTHRSKSKQEIEFQYGGRPFSQNGSSFRSTVDWDIWSKFGMQMAIHNFERMQSLNLNSEVDFWLCNRRLEQSIWRQFWWRSKIFSDYRKN